ncbi:MAG: Hsp70 family protein [Stackebrandtia sp.]
MAVINLGVDFGSTALRAAFAAPGDDPRTVTFTDLTWPWLLCVPSGDKVPPVSFTSVKSTIGINDVVTVRGEPVDVTEVLGEAFTALRARVEADTSASIGHTVISVPARYYTRQRSRLLDVANHCGLGTVSLVTDSVAAAVEHAGDSGGGTFGLIGVGYTGFELGVVRALGHRFRALGYDGGDALGGESLDAQILGGWWEAARRADPTRTVSGFSELEWRWQQGCAERLKTELLATDHILRTVDVTDPAGRKSADDAVVAHRRNVRSVAAHIVNRARVLLEHAGLAAGDLTSLLLFGGGTRIPSVAELARELGHQVVSAADADLSLGALRCAHRIVSRSPLVSEEPEQVSVADGRAAEVPLDPPQFTTPLITTPPGVRGPDSTETKSTIDKARQLMTQGRLAEAERLLRGEADENQRLLDDIAKRRPGEDANGPKAPGPSSASLVAIARAHFAAGRHTQAINGIHRAWERDHRPEVFEEMIDIHCRAAMANPAPSGYTKDMQRLRCALKHDPTSGRIRELLAQRGFLHGEELHRAGKSDAARRALKEALSFKPDHEAAETLLRKIATRR